MPLLKSGKPCRKRTAAKAGVIGSKPAKKAKKAKGGFDLCSAQLFLTYPKCGLKPEVALGLLQEMVPIMDYIIAQEEHEDGTPHLHVYLKLEKKIRRSKPDCFDLKSEGECFHGNYQGCRSGFRVQKYCKKGGVFITNMKFNVLRAAIVMAEAGDVKGAMDAVTEARPDMVLTGRDRVLGSLRGFAEAAAEAKEEEEPEMVFINVPDVMATWRRHKETLWLMGATGLGKTEFALSLFEKPLLVRHMDQLKALTPEHDGIVFDDVSLTHWPRTSAIHICDVKHKTGVNVKHGCVTLRKGLPRIFTSNEDIFPVDDKGAIKRRVHCVLVGEKMYGGDEDPETKPEDDWDTRNGDAMCRGGFTFQE